MSDLFAVVRQIDLMAHMEKQNCTIEHAGTTRRANPCPLCGHKDCCTLYPQDNTYKCFSCDSAGDIINFERAQNGHESNLAAAKALAKHYNIDTEDPKPPKGAKPPKNTSKNNKPADTGPTGPDLDPKRAAQVRRFAADLFHKTLMEDPDALKYQTKKRGHSEQTLARHMIGRGNANIMTAAKGQGITNDELLEVGLLRKRGKGGFSNAIPNHHFVYPHFIGGRIAHFTLKDPKKEDKWQLKRAHSDPDWIIYGQDALASSEIWMVEGEDDRITLMEYGGIQTAVAIIGNTNTPRILDWIGQNARGKTFYMAFDPDDAGKKYTAKFGAAAYNSGGTVYIVDLASHDGDIDDVLRAAGDPAAMVETLKTNAQSLNLSEQGEDSEYTFGSFEVLGEMFDGRLAFWSSAHRRTYFYEIKELTLDQLCQIGGWEVRERVSRTQQEGMLQFKSLKTYLICKAGDHYLGNLKVLGQGVHLLRDGRLLIVNGDEAKIWDGKTFVPQEYPILDRQYISGESDLRWIDMNRVAKKTLSMTRETAQEIVDKLIGVISRWQFAHSMEQIMLTGWVIAQVVQTAWEWRPQLWLSGASGSGKTMLTQLIEAIGGNLVCRFEGNILTEPGLRQTLQNHAYCTIIDEFEQSAHRDRIIERLRSAGRGGKGAIGSSKQEAVFSHIRHMILIASIETGLIRAAEQYRYLLIQTAKDNRIKPTIPSPNELEVIQEDMVAYALWSVFEAKKLIRNFDGLPGYDNRWVHSLLVPFSMIAVFDDDPDDTLRQLVEDYLEYWSASQEGGIMEDEASLLQDILLASVRVAETVEDANGDTKTLYVDRTVGQIIEFDEVDEEKHRTLQTYGIRVTEEDELFFYPEVIAKKLLGRTRWQDLNLRDILLRCENAKRGRGYIAGTRVRGVIIPPHTWVQT